MSGAEEAKILQSIAANVRRLRARRDLTQERLAEIANVDIRFVQKLESGKVNPSATTLVTFARALGVRMSMLFRPAVLEPTQVGRPSSRWKRKTR
jgi:transcriptional regulator with XRE-family HTH domain